jgi:hypothetical protein
MGVLLLLISIYQLVSCRIRRNRRKLSASHQQESFPAAAAGDSSVHHDIYTKDLGGGEEVHGRPIHTSSSSSSSPSDLFLQATLLLPLILLVMFQNQSQPITSYESLMQWLKTHPITTYMGAPMLTFIVGMATKDLVAHFISGIVLQASDKFYEGDFVRLCLPSTTMAGQIHHKGWLYTELRTWDEVITKIPNYEVVNCKVSNLSRLTKCQVKQVVRFHYMDLQKIEPLCQDIKEEICKCCPKVLHRRPFRVHWRNFGYDHVQVVVDCHFEIKYISDEKWDNRMQVLLCVERVARRHGVKFYVPHYPSALLDTPQLPNETD